MTPFELVDRAYRCLSSYGYTNWTVTLSPNLECAGKTSFDTKTVHLHPQANWEVAIHEIAHVRLGQFRTDFHDKDWENLVRNMGGTPRISYRKPLDNQSDTA